MIRRVLIFIAAALACTVTASASELSDALPPSVAEKLPNGLSSAADIDTDSLGFDFAFDLIAEELSEGLPLAASSLSVLLALTVFSAAARLIAPERADAVSLISSAFLGVYILGAESETAIAVEGFAAVISTFVTALSPLLASLHAATANTVTASVTSAGFLFFSAGTELVFAYLFVPLYKAALGFAVVSSVSGAGAGRIFDVIKRSFTLALSAAALIYITVLSYQTSLAAATDTLAARGVKFILSSSVPIVGGALGGAVGTTAAGLAVIKSASGALGCAVMIIISAPLIIRLLLSSAVYSVAAFAASLLGCDRESALLTELRGAVGFATATLSLVAVVFIISVAIFLKTAPAVAL